MSSIGITQVINTWQKPASQEEWPIYRKGYDYLLECHASVFRNGLRPTRSYDHIKSPEQRTFQYGQDVWEMNADRISSFCQAIIDNGLSWRELAELSTTSTPEQFLLFLIDEDIAA
jgi:hypothetical protein